MLTRRTTLVMAREPLAYLARIVATLVCTTFFSFCYLATARWNDGKKQDQIQPRTFLLMFVLGIPMQLILVGVYQYYQ